MIRISPRQLITIVALGAVALLAAVLSHVGVVGANGTATIVFLAALLAVLAAPAEGASGEAFDALRAAVRRVLDGLGIVILNTMQNFEIPLMWAAVLLTASISLAGYGIVSLAELFTVRRFT